MIEIPSHLATGISVVIPVYNGELVIERIIRQVLSQTYKDIELLIVDDGSNDNTPAIVDGLAKEDSRIRVCHQLNGGVSKARNKGIQEATKEYLTFIDADDEICSDYLSHMVSAMESQECDLVVSGYRGIPDQGICLDDSIYEGNRLADFLLLKNLGITFCKLYSTEIVKQKEIVFPVGVKLSEDAIFYYRYMIYVKRVATISHQDYLYYLPSDDRKYNLSFLDELRGLEAMHSALMPIIEKYSHSSQLVERLHQRVLIMLVRVVASVLAHRRSERPQLYGLINWPELLPMMKINVFLGVCLKFRLFRTFDTLRGLYQKVSKKDLPELLGV